MKRPLIVFFGSGPVAARSLELLAEHADIEAVVTKPRPPHHRGDVPVLRLAERISLPVHTAENKRGLSDLFASRQFQSRIGIVIDFGIIINQDVIDAFPLGILNSHFSLLPEWRGADPITFSILSGQQRTGVSLMLINDKLDEGPLLSQATFDLPADITTPVLTEALIGLSDRSLRQILPLYLDGETIARPQEEVTIAGSRIPTYSHKLSKEDGILDFTKSAARLEREVRAYLEWPKSRTTLGGKEVVITEAYVEAGSGTPGTIWRAGKHFGFYTSEGILGVSRIKPAGKQTMPADAFLAGYSQLLA